MLTIIMGILFVLSFIIYKIWDKNGQSYTPDWLDFLTIAFGVLFVEYSTNKTPESNYRNGQNRQ